MEESNNLVVDCDPGFFGKFTISPQSTYSWAPKEDITAYELARCMFVALSGYASGSCVESLPEECKRHFIKNK